MHRPEAISARCVATALLLVHGPHRSRRSYPMSHSHPTPTKHAPVSRRGFLKGAGGGVAGSSLLTMLNARQAPAQLKGTTLRILTWSHFIPAYDVWFDKWSAQWGEKNGVKVKVDHIPHLELPARMAAEFAAGAGHDIILHNATILRRLYHKSLLDMTHLYYYLGEPHRGVDPGGEVAHRGRGSHVRHPDVLHPAPHALAQGSLRGGGAQAAGHLGPGPRRRADAQIQGQPDGHRAGPLQRRKPRLAVGGVQLRRNGSRSLGRQSHARLEGDARGAPVRQGALRRGHDAGSILLGRCLGQPLPRFWNRRLDPRCHLGVSHNRVDQPDRVQEYLRRDGAGRAERQAGELRGAHRLPVVEVHEESAGGEGILDGTG